MLHPDLAWWRGLATFVDPQAIPKQGPASLERLACLLTRPVCWLGLFVQAVVRHDLESPHDMMGERWARWMQAHLKACNSKAQKLLRSRNSSNSGTVKAVSPCAGLQISPLTINCLRTGAKA